MSKYEVRCSECDSSLFVGESDTWIDAIVMADSCDCSCVDWASASSDNAYVTTLS